MVERNVKLFIYALVVITVLIAAGVTLYYLLYTLNLIPISFHTFVKVVATAVLGYLAITVIGRQVQKGAVKAMGTKRGATAYYTYRIVSYVALILLILGIAGVSGTALLAGGTFAGLIIGLAGNTVLSNVIAGILLLLARPFAVGDRVTITTWQYGMSMVNYSPKFYSLDRLIPGFTGVVEDIGLTYSVIKLDEGPMIKMPNNVVIQAAFIDENLKERWVRVRYELSSKAELDEILDALTKTVRMNEWVADPDSVRILVEAITQNSIVIIIDALCKGSHEEQPRSSILIDLARVVKNSTDAKD
jgi:small-conductance mechanosensitive channel